MISKGDLVKIRLGLGAGSERPGESDIFIFGRMMNYSEEEDAYILEPKAISVPKGYVLEINGLIEDFDFDNISEEISIIEKKRRREIPPEITNIRISRGN